MAYKALSLTRGEDKTYLLAFTHPASGLPYCLKNCVVFFTIKSNSSLPDSAALVQKIVTSFTDTTSGTSGTAGITLNRADTINLDPGEYDYDFSLLTAGSKTSVVQYGRISIRQEVTHSTGTAGTAA
jgi:hypothetical protein